MKFKKDITFFDIESTGVNTSKDRIISISLIRKGKDNPGTMNWLVNPGIPIPPSSTEVHGIKDEDVKGCPSFQEIGAQILEFIKGSALGGFNSNRFDIPLLFNEFERWGFVWIWKNHEFIDVGNIYKILNPRTLGSAYRFYVGEDLKNSHDAEVDTVATIAVFEKMYENGITNGDQELIDDISGLALLSNFGKEIVDLTGKFGKDKDGDIILNFSKHIGKKAKTELGFLRWMIQNDFPSDAKAIAKQIIQDNQPKKPKFEDQSSW